MFLRLLIIVLTSLSFLNLVFITPEIKKILDIALIMFFMFDMVLHVNVKIHSKFKSIIILLIVFPFLSAIPCFFYRHQAIIDTIFVTRTELLWLFFFYLHNNRVSPGELIKVISIIGVVGGIIIIIQQFTYPGFAFFGIKSHFETGELEIRNGIWRFEVNNTLYSLCGFFYFLTKFLRERRGKDLILLIICFAGVFLKMSRQFWFVMIASPLVYIVLTGGMSKIRRIAYLFVFASLFVIVETNSLRIFGEDVIDLTNQQIENEDYVRWLSYEYYGLEYWEGPINVLMGNGQPREGGNSVYANHISEVSRVLGLYRSDIGIVGVFSLYGIEYILVIIGLYILLYKNRRYLPPYLRIILLASFINLPLECWVTNKILMGMVLYLVDFYINHTKKQLIFKSTLSLGYSFT